MAAPSESKYFIAKDTGQPLEVLGYRILKDGSIERHTVPPGPTGPKPPTQEDLKLLLQHGESGLRKLELYGVLDRLGLLKLD